MGKLKERKRRRLEEEAVREGINFDDPDEKLRGKVRARG